MLTRGGTLREWNGEPVAFVVVEKRLARRYVGRRIPLEGPPAGGVLPSALEVAALELASASSMAECVRRVCARLGRLGER